MVAFGQIDLVVKDEARALPMLFVSLLFMAQQVHRGAVQKGLPWHVHVTQKSEEAYAEAEAHAEAEARAEAEAHAETQAMKLLSFTGNELKTHQQLGPFFKRTVCSHKEAVRFHIRRCTRKKTDRLHNG